MPNDIIDPLNLSHLRLTINVLRAGEGGWWICSDSYLGETLSCNSQGFYIMRSAERTVNWLLIKLLDHLLGKCMTKCWCTESDLHNQVWIWLIIQYKTTLINGNFKKSHSDSWYKKKSTSSANNEMGGNVLGKSICSVLLMVPVSDKDFFFQDGNNGKQMQKHLPEGQAIAALPKCQVCRIESI